MQFIGLLAISAVVTGLLSIWEGFVLMKLWAWFVIPVFGLPALTIPVAIGVALLVGFLTHQMRANDNMEATELSVKLISHGFVNAGVVLLVGWIVTFFM